MFTRPPGTLLLARRIQTSHSPHPFSLIGGLFLALILAILLLGSGLGWLSLTSDLPSIEILPILLDPQNGLLLQPTRLYDRHGRLLQQLSPAPRQYTSLQSLPPILSQSLLYTQDPTFWSHPGFTVKGLTNPQEHPTLAQHLVANLLLFQEPPTLRRAIRERLLAFQITQRFGRERILEWYLNNADFGQNVIGLASAAEIYLGKQPEDLSSAEALLLTSILQNPQITPHTLPEEARRRAHLLIQSLLQSGKLTPEEARSIEHELAAISFSPPPPSNEHAPTFLRLVLEQIQVAIPISRLEKGGLTLYTTLDNDLQQRAKCLLQLFAMRIAAQPEPIRCPEATPLPTLPSTAHISAPSLSALILDVPSGEILTAIGETFQGKESPIWSPHPPGAVLDPFIYLTAFARGWSPASLVWDLPSEGESATSFLGPMRMRRALANGLPRITQNLRHELGEAAIQRTFSLLGVQEDGVTLLQLANAYATLARSGGHIPPKSFLRLEGNDHALWLQSKPAPQELIEPAVTYLVNQVLSDPLARQDTWGYPGLLEIGRPVAVAMGSAAEGKQAWLIAYTPQRLVALWMGNNASETISPQWLGALGRALLEEAHRSLPAQDWPVPAGITFLEVCDPSGLLPSPTCPQRVTEVFLAGNEPHERDHFYQRYLIDRETGLLATVFTPPQLIEERIYAEIPPQARRWAEEHGWPQPPKTYAPIRLPPPDPQAHISQPQAFEEVSGRITIRGTAAGENFRSYRLLFGQGLNPQEWTLLTSAETPHQEEVLEEWDTTGLQGIYVLQLQVLYQDGRLAIALLPVSVK